MIETKSLLTSKTFWVNVLGIIVLVAMQISSAPDMLGIDPEKAVFWSTTLILIANLIIRYISTGMPITGSPAARKAQSKVTSGTDAAN